MLLFVVDSKAVYIVVLYRIVRAGMLKVSKQHVIHQLVPGRVVAGAARTSAN